MRTQKEKELKMAYERQVNMSDTIFRVNMRMGDFATYNKQLANSKFNPVAYNEYLTDKSKKMKRKKMWRCGGDTSRSKQTSGS